MRLHAGEVLVSLLDGRPFAPRQHSSSVPADWHEGNRGPDEQEKEASW